MLSKRTVLSLFLLMLTMAATAYAQVTYANVQTVPASGLASPYGIAVDQYDDVFIADANNNRVVEVLANGTQVTQGVNGGVNSPYGVAVDAAGDVYIADTNNQRIAKVAVGGETTSWFWINAGGMLPNGVALDSAGDIFAAGAFCVAYNFACFQFENEGVEFPISGSAGTLISGLGYTFGVAVDQVKNVYITDAGNNTIWVLPYNSNTGTWGSQYPLGSGLSQPYGVAVDGVGDIFIADTYNNRVEEIPLANGTFGTQFQVYTGSYSLSLPTGVAVDASGNVFISDTQNDRVLEVKPTAVNFGSVYVCTGCSNTIPLTFNVASDQTFGTTSILTQGTPNLDFKLDSSGNTCTGTVSGGGTCTVYVTFSPTAPGNRMGAVQLFDNSGNLLVTTMVHGTGLAPAAAIGPGTQSTVGGGISYPAGLATDAAGDVFIADSQNNRVVEILAGGGAQTTLPASGLNQPFAVALDGAGDVFIADYGNDRVEELLYLGNGSYGAQTTVNTGTYTLGPPYGVAVDASGNLFIADTINDRVVVVPAAGSTPDTSGTGPYENPFALGIGLLSPTGVSADGAGNLYVADWGNNRVVVIPYLSNGSYGNQYTLDSGGNGPWSTAVDAAGDVFIAYADQSLVVEVPAGGGYQPYVGSGLNFPYGVAVDAVGDVFIADTGNSRVVEVHRSKPPALSFATTNVGSISSDSPQSVTMQNIGNEMLYGTLTVGTNFVQVPGSGNFADCTASFYPQPGATCNLSISFEPQAAGNFTTSATFTDDALYSNPSATQSIALQGTGIGSQTITFTTPAPPTAKSGDRFTVAATGGASGNPVTFSVGAGSVCTLSGATYTMTSDTGFCYVVANQAGNSIYTAAPQVTETVTAVRKVVKIAPTVTFTGAPASAAYLSTFTVATTENSGITPTITSTTGTVCSVSSGAVTMKKGTGTCTVKASWAADTYYIATSLEQSTTATLLGTTTTITSAVPETNPLKVTVYFTVSNGTGTATTGNVQVTAASGQTCTGTVTSGKCVLTFTSAESTTLTAVYEGNTNTSSSTSASFPLTVN